MQDRRRQNFIFGLAACVVTLRQLFKLLTSYLDYCDILHFWPPRLETHDPNAPKLSGPGKASVPLRRISNCRVLVTKGRTQKEYFVYDSTRLEVVL